MLTWQGDDRFVLGGATFHVFNTIDARPPALGDMDFFLYKPRSMVERYVGLVEELKPQYLFELGIFGGGSTLFLAEVARPRRIAAIDREPLVEHRERVERRAAARGLGDAVRTFGGVDQADRSGLAQIVDNVFGGERLDLVIDDCSHMYEETRASFNELFPRVRPGGIYVIEDWMWAHTAVGQEPLEGMYPGRLPLTRLLFEIVLAIPGVPDSVAEISIDKYMAVIRRGATAIDPGNFDVSTSSNPRGLELLASS